MGREGEAALVKAAQRGEQRARQELAAAYLPLVYNIVGRALNGHADVDDVVQETMIRALNSLGSLRDPDSFRSWLVAITMNRIRGHVHAHRTEALVDGSLNEAHDVPDPASDFVELAILRLGLSGQRREVAEASRWLDADDRALLSLWWLEAAGRLSRAEVAAAMELTPQHTAVRVQRMKGQLEASRVIVRALAADPRCILLDDVVAHWDGVPSALWRKRLVRHTRDCTVCGGLGNGLAPAEGLLVGLALVPAAGALAGTATEEFALASAEGEPTYEIPAGGRLQQRQGRRRQRRRRIAVAAVAALVAGGGGIALLTPEDSDDVRSQAGRESVDTTAALTAPDASPSSVEESPSKGSPSPSRSGSPSPRPSRTRSAAPSTKPPAPRPTPTLSTARPDPTPVKDEAPPESVAGEVLALVNAERADAGCSAVRQNSTLDVAAQRHSDDMAARDFFDHTNPDGDDPGDRITAAGYTWSTYGENIAKGQQTPAQVMQGWMDSPGHRANILNCDVEEMGLGVHEGSGGPWWTQVFATAL
ncbi:sigma-70 family RNA polymerase sigma factor [Streptomyces sp. NPDC088387]|uniref:sigma-70 family RNA polymerase sigma factor n=1 Tax=Streptomyces sp. NPDC088387 TaxID=3365859 RepID=UPI00381FB904